MIRVVPLLEWTARLGLLDLWLVLATGIALAALIIFLMVREQR